MAKPLDEMTETEKFRYWMDLVDGKINPRSGYDVQSVKESTNKDVVTIVLKKQDDDANRT